MTVSRSANRCGAVGMAEQQRQLLGRRQQDVGRPRALARACAHATCRRCASRCGSAAASRRSASSGCARRRPPAPSAARYRACAGRAPLLARVRSRQRHEARQEAGQRLARAGRGDQQGRAALPRLLRAGRADAAAASSRARRTSRRTARRQQRATGARPARRAAHRGGRSSCVVVLIADTHTLSKRLATMLLR